MRWILVILSCWPMLLPPGFCLCRLDTFGVRTPGGAGAVTEESPETNAPRCPCCRHKSISHSHRDSDLCLKTDKPSGSPNETPHAPTCPAHPSWEVTRTAVAPDGPGPVELLFLFYVDLPENARPFTVSPDFPLFNGEPLHSSSPIHVLCCNFRC